MQREREPCSHYCLEDVGQLQISAGEREYCMEGGRWREEGGEVKGDGGRRRGRGRKVDGGEQRVKGKRSIEIIFNQ